ncbi:MULTISPECIES: hypothetical protein [Pseudoalteromonas]|uniref:Uncharacterized protein n=1 Tax=Pseudoalteromonas amylolytica TaxID=1859457 RepID=A0A1S1N0V3_9GAMM|nr:MULTISPECIES: hypothetical protein [Pseudoalteromonas]OHU85388.1 hypothetical protein BFC16_18725 [Pseudoalteromonas sp. JW3]OHU92991.1 hypothetical protein BET10_02990 [Pseudoalteromonas amylolytica]
MRRSRARRPTKRDDSRHKAFIIAALNELKTHPNKLTIIKQNCQLYKQQPHLKRGFLTAIERCEWVLEVDDDIDRIIAQILAEDYIGNRLRRYPLLFKGVVDD